MPTMMGFRHAPVSKGLLFATAGASILTQAARASRRRLPGPLQLASQAFVFRTPAELLFGTMLMYYFRVLERQSGSPKFGAFAFVATGLSGALQWAAAKAGVHAAGDIPSGPYGFIFACLVQYYFAVPPSSKMFLYGGWWLTDKVFMYLLGLQLLLPSGLGSVLAGASGLAAGLAYRLNVLGLKRFRLPKAVQRLVASALGPLLGDSDRPLAATAAGAAAAGGGRRGAAPAAAARPGGPGAAAAAAGGGAAGGDVAPSAPGLPPPSPEAVQQLVAMGFSEGEAARALQLANNDVQAAIGLLL